MKWISRTEEMILLSVHQLAGEAYGLLIREHLKSVSGRRFSVGAVYVPLERLEQKGLLTSIEEAPSPERGGRSKRTYRLTLKGLEALSEVKALHEAVWQGFSSNQVASEG